MKHMKNNPYTVTSLFDRQEILSDVAGFYAPTNRELSEALTVIGIRESVGVDQHLQEIYRRQQHNRVAKPENAVKAVTSEYIASYRSAESISRQLGALALDIKEIYNPNILLTDEIRTIKSAHKAFVRYCDLRYVYGSNEIDSSTQQAVLDRNYFSNSEEAIEYIGKRLGQISVKLARGLVSLSIDDQENRKIFWRDTLERIKEHRIAGPIVKATLDIKK